MKNNDLESHAPPLKDYIIVEGPDGLSKILETFLHSRENDPDFASQSHYILYQIGSQKSLIKVDISQIPFMFYYYDMQGRPITRGVKKILAKFLWEKCGLKEQYQEELEDE